MIGTKDIILAEDAKKLIESIDDELAFRFYIPDLQINKRIRSPLRKDNDPSFCIFMNRAGRLMYHDYSTGESGDIVKFVMQLTGLPYYTAIKKIARDLSLKTVNLPTSVAREVRVQQRKIKVIIKEFSVQDLIYWEQYGIRISNLKKYQVYAIDSVFLDNVLVSEYRKNQPIYGYFLGNGWKIYKPFSTQRFFMDSTTLQGYNQLPASGDLLVITKSMKDVILLDALGYPAVAPHGERVKIIDEISDLKLRFKKIVLLFDNDQPGIEGAKILSEKYDIPMVYIDPSEKAKDISDYYRLNNYSKTIALLSNLLCQKSEQSELVSNTKTSGSEC